MARVFDVAKFILSKAGPMTAMKLQKLVYYSQAWSLVWDERPLFSERFEAWANGPVCPALYEMHRGKFMLSSNDIGGNPEEIASDGRETIERVLDFYGPRPAKWLSDLTHIESPWKDARSGLPDGVRGDAEITLAAMSEYYGGLS